MITKKIKRATKKMSIDNGIYSVGIEAIYQGFKESKSPIDEELVFWTVVYTGFYGMEDLEVAELVAESSLPEFFYASRKALGRNPYIKAYLETYTQYKKAQAGTSIIEDVLSRIDSMDFEKIIADLPKEIKETFNVKK